MSVPTCSGPSHRTVALSQSPSVLVVADHAMALADAVASLGGAWRIRSSPSGPAGAEQVDVILLEQTIAPASPERLARLSAEAPAAAIVSVVAEGRGRYSWVCVRQSGVLYRIEATGLGSLADAVQMATSATTPNETRDLTAVLAR